MRPPGMHTHRILVVRERLVELARGALPVARLAVLVVVVPHERLVRARGHAERRGHDRVHLLHELLLLRAEHAQDRRGGERRVRVQRLVQRAQDERVLAQLRLQERVERAGGGGVLGLLSWIVLCLQTNRIVVK